MTASSNSAFLAERVRLVFSDSWGSLPINLINAGVVALVHRDVLPVQVPIIWFLFLGSVVGLRIALYIRYRRAEASAAAARLWARRLMLVLMMTGLGWGVGGIVMMSLAPPTYQVLIAFVLGGMAAGGMPSLSRIFTVYVVFVVPILLPAIVFFAHQGTELGVSVAAMGTLLLGFLLAMGRRQESNIVDSMQIARENRNLVDDLRREIDEREHAESRLRLGERTLARAQRIAQMGSWEWNLADDQVISTSENNRLFGRERDAPPYSHEASLQEIHPEDRERVKTIINRSVAEASTYSCDYRIRLPDGGERVIFEQADVTCDESGDPVRVTGITLDITERYRAQEQLRGAVREAEAASEAKSQFMANMSHELRTPLNAIIGYSEILKEDALERGETSFIPDLDKINTAGRHLLELINDVLDLSRIEAGRSEIFIETVALSPFLDEILTTAEPMMSANNNRFTLKCQAEIGEIRTDVVKLRQILINLLSNAAKFTENGDVRLQVSRFTDDAGAGGAEWIRIAVSDTGIGIAPEDLTTVFNAFERSEAGRASRYDGTGLGLAICHHYCEMLGGVISAKSNLGKGSVFSIRLPQTADDDNRAKNAATA